MLKQLKKSTISLLALFAITIALFKVDAGETTLSVVSNKPYHSTKTAFTRLTASSVLLLLEMDSEEAFDGEETDEEVKDLAFEFELFSRVTFAALERARSTQAPHWSASATKGYHAPIYLLNNNFRL